MFWHMGRVKPMISTENTAFKVNFEIAIKGTGDKLALKANHLEHFIQDELHSDIHFFQICKNS